MKAAVLSVGMAAALLAADPFAVRFLAPLPTDVLIGKSDIILQIDPPAGSTILKVEVYADDKLVTTLLDPPWKFAWDAGDSLRARALRARAFASDGSAASARVLTQALKGAQRARVTLVEVYCTVRDEQGSYLMDLKASDFKVSESGKPQTIAAFSSARKPAHLVLLIDTSASMKKDGRIDVAREAAVGFIEALEPRDTAALIAFSDAPHLLTPATSDRAALISSLESVEASGGTALYDSVMSAVEVLKGVEGRKAIILLSDGRDEAVDGMGPGSFRTFEETLDALLKSEIALYAVGTGDKLEEAPDFEGRRTVGEILGMMTSRSGGRAYFVRKASKLKDAYRQIEDELRHQYTLSYYPSNTNDAGGDGSSESSWRSIEVKVSIPRARVAARSGYFAR